MSESEDNVISLSEKRRERLVVLLTEEESDNSFAEIMRKNEENRRRVERERARNNKGVTRSYGLQRPKK